MGKQKRSLVGYLIFTAWESWEAEPRWRNAVIVALAGSIALALASHKSPAPDHVGNATASALMSASVPEEPPSLKPKILTNEVIIRAPEKKEAEDPFGRSYEGE